MKIVILGLSITSSWGNGHATTYRGLVRELTRRGHDVLFLERDQPWYAENRDLPKPPFCRTALYRSARELRTYSAEVASADCVVLGSYVPQGIAVGEWLTKTARGVLAFYDIDTPVTLAKLAAGTCDYLAPGLIPEFDFYLSFTGGPTLRHLEQTYGARRAEAFYCSVDPAHYFPEAAAGKWDLGYLGTYSDDRQPALDRLLIQPARHLPKQRFVVAGPQYPAGVRWPRNVHRIEHLSPAEHRGFYNAQRFTLNVTRADMVRAGWSPSVRLFEAAACGTPIISDAWEGLESVLEPGREILVASAANEVQEILHDLPDAERRQIGARARERVLTAHTAAHRAKELEMLIAQVSNLRGPQWSRLPIPAGREDRRRHARQARATPATERLNKHTLHMKTNGSSSKKVRVAIIGVGNCASSLVQGVQFYRDAKPDDFVPGLMHVDLGGYHPRDIEFTAAFDVNANKVGRDLSEAISAEPNNTVRFAEVPPLGVKVHRGMTHDGLGKYLKQVVPKARGSTDDIIGILKKTKTDVVVSYLPVGSEMATKWYVEQVLEAGCAFINCIPVFIASAPYWQRRFAARGLPIIGDDIKSQVGATIVHRILTDLFRKRGVRLDRTYQLNFGGNTDFLNMLERERLESKKISKTQAVTSQLGHPMLAKDVHVGPSDYVPWLSDRKWCYIRMEGTTFGDVPLNCEVKLEVWDSPNSAGVVIDAIRCAKIALDRGIGGALDGPSSYFMKSPPVQFTDDEAQQKVEAFIAGEQPVATAKPRRTKSTPRISRKQKTE